ncbi:peptidylprolyl isomerase fpr3 [Coemansia thaxteri]|nr:peptidylprolyl isomerase fpr3 [Coemansia thaxteri]
MIRGFWGLKIVPGKTYTQTVDASFRVSNAALGVTLADEGRTSVLLTVDQKSFVLCSLTPGKIEQQGLDIGLTEGEEITFESQGNNEIHLTGNFIIDDEDDEDGMYGSSDDEEEHLDLSQLSIEEIQELHAQGLLGEEDDEDYDSDDAEADGRIREVTSEEEDELVAEASSEDEEMEARPVIEVKIKKQAEKKRKPAAEEEAVAAAAVAKPNKKAKAEAKKAEAKKAEDKKPKAEDKKPEAKKAGAKAKTLPGGVVVETQKEGEGSAAKKGQRVGMYYIGKLTNGKVFDQNTKGKPFWFRLGGGEVIKGWDAGILGMKKGEERRLTIPAPMGYGSRGAPPDIPPHATLVFDIRMVELK